MLWQCVELLVVALAPILCVAFSFFRLQDWCGLHVFMAGGLSDSWFLLGTLWTARTESGVELEWDSLVLSPPGHAIWSQMLLWGSGLLKGETPKGPLTALDFWEPQLQSPVPKVTWAIGPRTQDSSPSMRLLGYAVIMDPSWIFISPFSRGNWMLWKFLILVFRRLK